MQVYMQVYMKVLLANLAIFVSLPACTVAVASSAIKQGIPFLTRDCAISRS
jgi:hypothetical protein